MAAGFPAPVVAQIPSNGRIDAGADARLRNAGYVVIPTDLREGLLHSWNVAYQREIGANFTAEVAYVGNHGQDIIQRLDLNAGYTLGAGNAGRPQFAQFGRTASVTAFLPYHTDYHSMQVKVDRRFKNNFLITNSYTLGKGESYDGGDSNGSISTPIDIERSWGRTVNDRKHTFVSSFVYGLPFQKEGWLGALVNGWQMSGIFTGQSGLALDITMDGALLNTPGNTQRPDLVGDPDVLGNVGGGTLWFDTTAFAAPAANTFGNLTRNGAGVNAPAYYNLDASLVKKIPFGHRFAEIRDRRVQRHQLAAPEQPGHHVRQRDVRADHRRIRSAPGPLRPPLRVLAIHGQASNDRRVLWPRSTTTPAGPSSPCGRRSRKAAPKAEETISYGFPAFRLNGKLLACFRGARAHCSYHPMSGRIVAANRAALSGYETSAGTIRFPIGTPLPARIVRLLVKARIAEMDAPAGKKAAAKKPAPAKPRPRRAT